MKKLLIIVAMATTIFSCTETRTVKLLNGSKVEACNLTDMTYSHGEKVCINNSGKNATWIIDTSGDIKDTTYMTLEDLRRVTRKYRIGYIGSYR